MASPQLIKDAKAALKINPDNKTILCIDGGGMRGILTVQLLKQIESITNIPCYELFDMVAGTSTGGIMAGLIASGKTAAQIETLYVQLVTNVFKKRGAFAGRIINPPRYDKVNYRSDLASVIGDKTLAQVCAAADIDLMITAKDVTGNEETFFTCFNTPAGQQGTYKDALLNFVMEATMSAPTYFLPFERFVDGGTTAFNNPSLAAVMEAVCYGGKGKYEPGKLTIFSLGTGMTVKSVPAPAAASPNIPAVSFWLNYVMDESSQDASTAQVDVFRSGLIKDVDYRRYQISFDTAAIRKIPDAPLPNMNTINASSLHTLTDKELQGIAMDDVTKFDLVKLIGQSMAQYIMQANKFTRDLTDTPTGRDELVTAFGDVSAILANMNNRNWINNIPTK